MGCVADKNRNETIENTVLSTLITAADYAANVLIDEEGKSRCDYDIVKNEWSPYEEPWHTGQLINALLEAYRITGKKEYLNTDRKSTRLNSSHT